MKGFFLILIALLIVPVISAYDPNMTPVIISFSGGHVWGENPVIIADNETGQIAFMGNTSSRNITLQPDRGFVLRVEPAGLTDAGHNFDNVLVGACEWVGRNPIGWIAGCLIAGAFLSAAKRRKGK